VRDKILRLLADHVWMATYLTLALVVVLVVLAVKES
jgi:hypothetical protein